MEYKIALENFHKTKDKNIFEDLYSQIILENSDLFTEEDIARISQYKPRQRRGAILSKLDRDRGLFLDIAKKALLEKMPKLKYMREVLEMLRKYVKVGEIEKEKFGEVMTPIDLVEEMLRQLPKDVWSDPNLKWLEPCNGSGPYLAYVIKNLMFGLKNWEPDEEKRYKHVIENMVYACELQPKNQFIYLCLVDPWDIYACNVYTGSFFDVSFDKHMKEVWGVEKFDIILGNPPYLRNLHLDFLLKSYNICNLVLMVHPNSWLVDEKNHTKIYLKTKSTIQSDLKKCIFVNPNQFDIKLSSPCTITYIDKNTKLKEILVSDKINKIDCYFNNIDHINKWNNNKEYISIKNKIDSYIQNKNSINFMLGDKGLKYYINIARVRGNIVSNSLEKLYSDDFFTLLPKDEGVSTNFTKNFCLNFDNKESAENCLSYLKTYTVRFCYSINKNDLSNNKIDMSRIPIVDFGKIWTDEKLVSEFCLSSEEFNFIKSIIPKYY